MATPPGWKPNNAGCGDSSECLSELCAYNGDRNAVCVAGDGRGPGCACMQSCVPEKYIISEDRIGEINPGGWHEHCGGGNGRVGIALNDKADCDSVYMLRSSFRGDGDHIHRGTSTPWIRGDVIKTDWHDHGGDTAWDCGDNDRQWSNVCDGYLNQDNHQPFAVKFTWVHNGDWGQDYISALCATYFDPPSKAE